MENTIDPPKEVAMKLKATLEGIEDCRGYEQALSQHIAEAFWDTVCMVVFPNDFDHPDEVGGRGVRKSTVSCERIAFPKSKVEAIPAYVDGFCSTINWITRFEEATSKKLKKHMAVSLASSELRASAILCPKYFSMEGEGMVPNDTLLERAVYGDEEYLSTLLKLMAKICPLATIDLLSSMVAVSGNLSKYNQKKLDTLNAYKNTSTTKQTGHCIACGLKGSVKEGTLKKCTRCQTARYCK